MHVRALDESTWPGFAALVERSNGVWGGCWCMGFHEEGVGRHKSPGQNRAEKEARVREGRAHAALVFEDGECVGWCQFGSPDELPRIKRKRAYLDGGRRVADWRITCFFVESSRRRSGVAAVALAGALEEIARLGGGIVESFPEDADGRRVSGSFLHNGTLALFERHGFERVRRLGKHHWLVTKVIG
jgi:GNAT superfamily N-acetyltransferase